MGREAESPYLTTLTQCDFVGARFCDEGCWLKGLSLLLMSIIFLIFFPLLLSVPWNGVYKNLMPNLLLLFFLNSSFSHAQYLDQTLHWYN